MTTISTNNTSSKSVYPSVTSSSSLPLPNSPDYESVTRLINTLFQAWRTGSAESYSECFTENGTLINFNGQKLNGKKEIKIEFEKLFSTWLMKGSELICSTESKQIQFLSPTTALITQNNCGIKLRWQSKGNNKNMSISSAIAVKQENGEWKLVSLHSTKIQEKNWWIKPAALVLAGLELGVYSTYFYMKYYRGNKCNNTTTTNTTAKCPAPKAAVVAKAN